MLSQTKGTTIATSEIIKLFEQGFSHRQIAKQLGMGRFAVTSRLRRAPGYQAPAPTKKVCEFQGGAGKDEKYRPPAPCLGEFEVDPQNAKVAKYCPVCAPFAKRWLNAQTVAAAYRAAPQEHAKAAKKNRIRRRKAAGRPIRLIGSMQPCEYRDEHGKRGEGCEITYKLRSSSQRFCDSCQKLVEACRKRKARKADPDKFHRSDKARNARSRNKVAQAEQLALELREDLEQKQADSRQLKLQLEGSDAQIAGAVDEMIPQFNRLFSLLEVETDPKILLRPGWTHPDFSLDMITAAVAALSSRKRPNQWPKIAAVAFVATRDSRDRFSVKRAFNRYSQT